MTGKILITGATGNVGASLVQYFSERSRLKIGVRNIEKARQALGDDLDYVAFDLTNPQTFAAALADVEKVFLVRPPALADIKIFEPFIQDAKEKGVQHIVFLSLQGIERVQFVPHAKIEAAILASGIPYTFLRAGFFMQNLNTAHRSDILEYNDIFLPAGKSKTAFIDVRDIGAVAAKILSESGHENCAYTLTGAELLDYFDVAEIFTEVLGRPIRYPNPNLLSFAWRLWRHGNPLPYILVTSFLYTMTRFGQAAEISPDVSQILGREPISFRQYVEDYREEWL